MERERYFLVNGMTPIQCTDNFTISYIKKMFDTDNVVELDYNQFIEIECNYTQFIEENYRIAYCR